MTKTIEYSQRLEKKYTNLMKTGTLFAKGGKK